MQHATRNTTALDGMERLGTANERRRPQHTANRIPHTMHLNGAGPRVVYLYIYRNNNPFPLRTSVPTHYVMISERRPCNKRRECAAADHSLRLLIGVRFDAIRPKEVVTSASRRRHTTYNAQYATQHACTALYASRALRAICTMRYAPFAVQPPNVQRAMHCATSDRRALTPLVLEIVPPLSVTTPSSMLTTPPLSCAQPKKPRQPHRPRTPSTDTRPNAYRQDSHRRPAHKHPCSGVEYRHGVEKRVALGHGEHAAAGLRAHECIAPPLGHRKARPSPNRAANTRHTPHDSHAIYNALNDGCATGMLRDADATCDAR
jgi:hypothetical protein